jgi:hypothetical protein
MRGEAQQEIALPEKIERYRLATDIGDQLQRMDLMVENLFLQRHEDQILRQSPRRNQEGKSNIPILPFLPQRFSVIIDCARHLHNFPITI